MLAFAHPSVRDHYWGSLSTEVRAASLYWGITDHRSGILMWRLRFGASECHYDGKTSDAPGRLNRQCWYNRLLLILPVRRAEWPILPNNRA